MESTRPNNSRKFLYCRVQTEVNVKMSKHKHETNEERRSKYQICGDPLNTNWKLQTNFSLEKIPYEMQFYMGNPTIAEFLPKNEIPRHRRVPQFF